MDKLMANKAKTAGETAMASALDGNAIKLAELQSVIDSLNAEIAKRDALLAEKVSECESLADKLASEKAKLSLEHMERAYYARVGQIDAKLPKELRKSHRTSTKTGMRKVTGTVDLTPYLTATEIAVDKYLGDGITAINKVREWWNKWSEKASSKGAEE